MKKIKRMAKAMMKQGEIEMRKWTKKRKNMRREWEEKGNEKRNRWWKGRRQG
jgi:hypothetical protein